MEGIEIAYADLCIRAVLSARRALMNMTIVEAVSRTRYGKVDTLGLDCAPEVAIKKVISDFESDALLVTEEEDQRAQARLTNRRGPSVVFVSDPTDRSKFLKRFLEHVAESYGQSQKVGEVLCRADRKKTWGTLFSEHESTAPLAIVGPSSAITCVRNGRPYFTAIVNYLSDEIVIAGPTGVFILALPDYREIGPIDVETISVKGAPICFPAAKCEYTDHDSHLRFVTYLGKPGYEENFEATAIFLGKNPKSFLHHPEPGGPARVLYLSNLQNEDKPIGFVMSNGEKISEFCHWLPFVMYGKAADGRNALSAYEIAIDRPWTKEGILMSPSEIYSIFQIRADGREHFLDVGRLRGFHQPSHFRSTLIVTQADNKPIQEIMERNCYRKLSLS